VVLDRIGPAVGFGCCAVGAVASHCLEPE
jgi:hypothetical protein